jgi:outer membrane protein assembly factor BamD (BamD/ComL family)
MRLIKCFFIYLILLNTTLFCNNDSKLQSVQKYYSFACDAFEKYNWSKVIEYCNVIIKNYPDSAFVKESLFYLGVAYFNLKEYEASNRYFTRYLKDDYNPKFFEETMYYKFSIAENFQKGTKKRLFGCNSGPKILDAKEDALVLFDEIIASMPMHDLAAKSLFAKGKILFALEEYKDSISVFEQLIEKFEKHELTAQSFIEIGKVYLKQTTYKKQDPDILDLAQLNLKKFEEKFSEEREKLKELRDIILQIKEKFALGFLEIAEFYEKTNKKDAALIYYSKIINSFSETKSSEKAKKKFDKLNES